MIQWECTTMISFNKWYIWFENFCCPWQVWWNDHGNLSTKLEYTIVFRDLFYPSHILRVAYCQMAIFGHHFLKENILCFIWEYNTFIVVTYSKRKTYVYYNFILQLLWKLLNLVMYEVFFFMPRKKSESFAILTWSQEIPKVILGVQML